MRERSQVIEKKSDGEKGSSAPKARNTEFCPSTSRPADRILSLQRTIGNQAVQRLFKGVGGQIQPKLTIGQPNDIYEQEADRVAEQVMRMPEPHVQRQIEEEEEEELIQTKPLAEQIMPSLQEQVDEEKELQAKELSGQTSEISPNLEARLNAIRGGGQPLPVPTRAFFEPRFDYDFSQVRVHTDVEADTFNRALDARSFATGQDIFFREGEYNPDSSSGQKLLAHELSHVVQQTGGRQQAEKETEDFVKSKKNACCIQKIPARPEGIGWRQTSLQFTFRDYKRPPALLLVDTPAVNFVGPRGEESYGEADQDIISDIQTFQIWIKPEGAFRISFRPVTIEEPTVPEAERAVELELEHRVGREGYGEVMGPAPTRIARLGDRVNLNIPGYNFRRFMRFQVLQGSTVIRMRARSLDELNERLRAQGTVGVVVGPVEAEAEVGAEAGRRSVREIERQWEVRVPLPTHEITQL